jgi:hypothetical protein
MENVRLGEICCALLQKMRMCDKCAKNAWKRAGTAKMNLMKGIGDQYEQ